MSMFSSTPKVSSPHALQRTLMIILLTSVTAVSVLLGVLYNAGMRQTLMDQVGEQLKLTTERALNYSADISNGKIQAPGQSAGTLTARFDRLVFFGGVLDKKTGEFKQLGQQDAIPMVQLPVSDVSTPGNFHPRRAKLTVGDYYLVAVKDSGSNSVLVVGLPLADTDMALREMAWLTLFIAMILIVGAGLAGSWLISRSLAPLKRVAIVATSVADADLDSGKVELTQRVNDSDATPGTEVGNVGYALNAMIDNVSTALTVREKSQAQMRQFVADASHELRTPLSSIRGYTELIAATEHFSPDGQRSVERVLQQSSRMSSLVENLLLLARLDEANSFRRAKLDLGLLTADITEDFRVTADDHIWEFDCEDPQTFVNADASSLRRVITNLLANARKHTTPGNTVTMTVSQDLDTDEAVLRVHDTGEGIDPEFLPKVFERFTRADKARSGSDGTTGLGLPIAKSIVEAHGGSISVESSPGNTTFEVRLPLYDEAQAGQDTGTAASTQHTTGA
ncbi:sensor histidine kinase [Glutamicibacter uratoxydans]|uniref:histidine kinase n=1 Tax=Glutamicibacter uratoxydans TaxID=43667 RepID=A0A4Y4DMN5_GLUUR|nr:HAMP domain-containing sensor histidine kinase [Glutamicibacter uratoxydans]GED06206.1 sensor histidine kinase [Glutamicibacter uratoxydans]